MFLLMFLSNEVPTVWITGSAISISHLTWDLLWKTHTTRPPQDQWVYIMVHMAL